MSQLKWYNPGTAQWEPMLIGAQGPVGPTGQTGPTGPTGSTPTDYVSSFNGVTGAITGVNSVNGSTGTITGLATTAGNLSQFGATTSAQLAGILSDETGTGPNVFATGPVISLPSIDNPKLGYTTTTTSVSTVTLTASSNYQQYFTGSTAQTITLPVASTMTLGQSFKIVNNNTANSLTVNSSGGNAVITVPVGFNAEVTCILTSGTTAASWSASYCDFDTTTGTGSVVLSAAPTFTGVPLSTTAAVDTNSTQIATTAYVVGQASAATPLVNGTATVGTSLRYAREGHIHPTDTTRAATSGNLSQFAATTSAQLAGVISDETGSGSLVFGTSPSLTTPVLDSINGGQIAGMRNVLINGGFAVDQRNAGATQTFTAGAALAYSVDRWYGYCTGASVTGARIAGATPDQYYYRFTGATSNTAVGFGQRIEAANSYYLAGQTARLSVKLASSSLTSVTWTAYYATTTDSFGTVAVPTRTQIATGTFTGITSTIASFNASVSVPSAAITGIEIVFTTGALTATNTLTFSAAQFELGTVATPFERRPIGTELALCQRYYWRMNSDSTMTFTIFATGNATSTTSAGAYVKNPVTMRTIPLSIDTTGIASNYGFSNNIGTVNALSAVPSLSTNSRSADITAFVCSTASGLTAGGGGILCANSNGTAYIGINAEF